MPDGLPDSGNEDFSALAGKILRKKAEGFEYSEITDEFSADGNGELILIKRKVSTKYVPPDLSALKVLIGAKGAEGDYGSYTDEELESERHRLLKELFGETNETQEVQEVISSRRKNG